MNDWSHGTVSVHGKNHVRDAIENQDFALSFEIEDCCIIIGSDGAGSAKNGRIGAEKLVTNLREDLGKIEFKLYKNIADNQTILKETIIVCVDRTRKELVAPNDKKSFLKRAFGEKDPGPSSSDIRLGDFAATLLIAICSPYEFFSAHIGDGYIFGVELNETKSDAGIEVTDGVVSLPRNGEYDNQTYFFTDKSWENNIRFESKSFDVTENKQFNTVAILTDGADSFFISSDRKSVHLPLIKNLAEIVASQGTKQLSNLLPKIFTQEKIHSVTGDDATIGLAIRC